MFRIRPNVQGPATSSYGQPSQAKIRAHMVPRMVPRMVPLPIVQILEIQRLARAF